ncbi:SpaA isopeptide-forming pilin-related protein [Streptomyces sp. NBC_00237]|uniref:SpaA isopeptide-forming pilin-related protein n=1 Tax=Streptomyces sp. NBC_00237 TaxID=2975687 RepID=UPI002258FCB6|nr:SpaA isopeptide-forming pilin-related protein [Streptomyces sp. NBC_00237]MCX5204547.1 SpaA isopeptide-forming pilin-related protein [Streptomyces sp. NBC_00237]
MSPPMWSRSPRLRSSTVAAATVLLTAASLVGPVAVARGAVARAAEGTVTVNVVRDVDSDGTWTPVLEVGEAGLPVTVTDAAGNTGTAMTGADGKVTFSPSALGLSGGRYRVEVVVPPDKSYLKPAQAGGPAPALSSLVEFVDVADGKDASVLTAVHNPADYCQANPDLATACSRQSGAGVTDTKGLVSWPYDRTGQGTPPDEEATFDRIGATYGLAHKRDTDELFVGALTKRLSPYGPAGPGGIYQVDRKTKQVTTFAVVPDAGDAVHSADLTRDTMEINDAVGKEGLGDLDLSEDQSTLYAVGLKARSLYAYDSSTGALKQTLPIPDPGCPSGAADWRPYGLGVHDGAVYVGGTCSAESTQRDADLRAYVLKLTGSTFTTEVSHALDYPRGMGYESIKGDTAWRPWLKTWDPYKWFQQANFPGPILSDLVFDRDGSMVLGFRDRLGDQAGYEALPPEGSTDTVQRSLLSAMGDITRVCRVGGAWVWDSDSAACPNHFVNGTQPPQQDGVPEYYPGDSTLGQLGEAAMGGLAHAPRFRHTVATFVDPHEIFTGGVRKFDNATGEGSENYEVIKGQGSFGKANTLGDLELLCDEAPVQIGNRVWFDRDRDGIQGAAEEPLPGATVTLKDKNGAVLETTTTNARGEYYFQVKPRTEYRITFDVSTSDTSGLPEKPAPTDLLPSAALRGDNISVDSNPDPATQTEALTTGAAGHNDHTHDAGYHLPRGKVTVLKKNATTGEVLPGAVFQLWRETNGKPGLQEADDTKVGAPCTTDGTGACTTEVDLGTYYWQETRAPRGYQLPDPNVFGPLVVTGHSTGKGATVTVANKPIPPVTGGIGVLKKDAKTGRPLLGAVFELWRETNGKPGLQMPGDTRAGAARATDERGRCAFTGLPQGDYYLRETAVPEGYRLPARPISGPHRLTGSDIVLTRTNERGEPVKK